MMETIFLKEGSGPKPVMVQNSSGLGQSGSTRAERLRTPGYVDLAVVFQSVISLTRVPTT